VAKGKRTHGKLSIFKGREAKLNFAIFQVLALKGPQTIYDIHKELKAKKRLKHVRYASVNKRVRILEESDYINKIGVKKTKAGFQTSIYELTVKAYLAILLNSINLEELVQRVDESAALAILATVVSITQPSNSNANPQRIFISSLHE
jgi:hypothetical protein